MWKGQVFLAGYTCSKRQFLYTLCLRIDWLLQTVAHVISTVTFLSRLHLVSIVFRLHDQLTRARESIVCSSRRGCLKLGMTSP